MVQKFNIGADGKTQIVLTNGGLLKPAIITRFTYKQDVIDLKSRPVGAQTINRRIPDGWSGSFDFDRSGPELDDYFAQLEDDYYQGVPDITAYIVHTIREVDRSLSQYRFNDIQMTLSNGGSWEQVTKVTQTIDWMAVRRIKVI